MRRKIALVGCKEGPWVSTRDLHEPRLEITGRKLISVVEVSMRTGDEITTVSCDALGRHVLVNADWMQVRCLEPKGIICQILGQKKVA